MSKSGWRVTADSGAASGQHQSYLDNPGSLAQPSTIADGNNILGHLLGSKDASRTVASNAAAQTGLSPDVIKQMLPIAAAMLMGAAARHSAAAVGTTGTPASSGGLASLLTPLLDRNRDGSMVDDVTGVTGKFLGTRLITSTRRTACQLRKCPRSARRRRRASRMRFSRDWPGRRRLCGMSAARGSRSST